MPTETKNSTANASRIGSASEAARTLKSDRPTTRPARNAPSAIDTPKISADATAMPSAVASTASVNSSRDCVRATCASSQGIVAAADDDRECGEEPRPWQAPITTEAVSDPSCVPVEDRRHQDEHEHREAGPRRRASPTAMWPAGVCSWRLSDKHANQDDGARDRQRDAEDDARRPRPAGEMRDHRAEPRRHQALDDGARNRHAPDRQQIFDVKLQTDAEHQQDHADFGELLRQRAVGDEARRVRPDDDAGDEIADNRRQPQPLRDEAADQRRDQAAGQRQDQIEPVHGSFFHSDEHEHATERTCRHPHEWEQVRRVRRKHDELDRALDDRMDDRRRPDRPAAQLVEMGERH